MLRGRFFSFGCLAWELAGGVEEDGEGGEELYGRGRGREETEGEAQEEGGAEGGVRGEGGGRGPKEGQGKRCL